MSNRITQDMKYRQFLMQYEDKYGVQSACKKYNKSRSYICFWRKRQNRTEEFLSCHFRRADGYSRTVEDLYRCMRREELIKPSATKKKHQAKPSEKMTHLGERIQIDVKVVPRHCITDNELRLYQYTAIDEYSRYRILGAYLEQTADFLRKAVHAFARKGIKVECSFVLSAFCKLRLFLYPFQFAQLNSPFSPYAKQYIHSLSIVAEYFIILPHIFYCNCSFSFSIYQPPKKLAIFKPNL